LYSDWHAVVFVGYTVVMEKAEKEILLILSAFSVNMFAKTEKLWYIFYSGDKRIWIFYGTLHKKGGFRWCLQERPRHGGCSCFFIDRDNTK